jgi:hypothetical protein
LLKTHIEMIINNTHTQLEDENQPPDLDVVEKLENFIKVLLGTKRLHHDLYEQRNLDYLISCRDSSCKIIRCMGIYVLSQYLLSK